MSSHAMTFRRWFHGSWPAAPGAKKTMVWR